MLKKCLPIFLLLLLGVAGLLIIPASSSADSFEKLIMPGPVIKGHKKYEDECSNCHKIFDKKAQNALCLDCHKKTRKDIKLKKGFHGKKKSVRVQQCNSCHTDHQGRGADIIKLAPSTFNHNLTDFPLKKQHARTSCQACHKAGKKYREAPSACISCHKKNSPHNPAKMGKFSKTCKSCHTEDNWLQLKFNHDKTRFALHGKHNDTECTSCHAGDHYIKTPHDCYSCHKSSDVHKGRNGKKCQKCHSPNKWKKVSFDHDKKTKFPLRGKHDRISCQACHKQPAEKVKLKKTCVSCHGNDDKHKGRFGNKCQSCHNASSWKKNFFNHDKKTKFKLRGKHKKAHCGDCHKGKLYKKTKIKQDCYSCHRIDDKHKGQQGKQCQRCHNETSWRGKVRFDHDVTHFPLIGLHALTPCEECHLTSTYKNAKSDCNNCHSADDEHNQKLGTQCEDCHTPNGWGIWEFDHNRQSLFKIDGKHKGLHCHSCHRSTVQKIERKPRPCSSCHRNDDPHNGQFGSDCERCHTTRSFRDIKMR